MRVGIVGLPNVGKSTLFNALTRAAVPAENYPFCTIEPNVGQVSVPDDRLLHLSELIGPERLVPAAMEFVDIAGLVKGASRGEGLGNQFLGHIRNVDAVVEVVRCFEDPNVSHVSDWPDPASDIETLELELMLADAEAIERRLVRTVRQQKTGDVIYRRAADYLSSLHDHLQSGRPARDGPALPQDLQGELGDLNLLTAKPRLLLANVGAGGLEGAAADCWQTVQELADRRGAGAIWLAAQLEVELWELDAEDRALFLSELGLEEPGLERLIRASFSLLDLIQFFTTTGSREVRAWPVKRGTSALAAAGKIHTDMETGFIRAEVVSYEDLIAAGSVAALAKAGLMRLEGRDYVVQDGDVIHFRFAV